MKVGIARKLTANRSGGIAAITALMMPVLIGTAGLASDTIQWVWIKRAMQRQADSAALAGAFAAAQESGVAGTVATDLARNANFVQTEAPVVENAPTSGVFMGNMRAVRVMLATDVSLPFTRLIMGRPQRISAEATAAVVGLGEFCVLALENTPVEGIYMSGSATVDLNCGLMTNSPAASAIYAGGSSEIAASPVSAVGGVPTSNNYATGTELFPYAVRQIDPYEALPDPGIMQTGSKGDVKSNQRNAVLQPGVYSSLNIQGTATLQPGTYYVNGGQVKIGAQAVVNGSGVTIVLGSSTAAGNPASIATIDMNGGATVNLTAPETGTYAGVLIYQDRNALMGGQSNKINGNSASKLQGAIYFPGQEIEFTGNSAMNINCIKLVARRITFTGNSTITNTCPANSGVKSILGTRIKLVA